MSILTASSRFTRSSLIRVVVVTLLLALLVLTPAAAQPDHAATQAWLPLPSDGGDFGLSSTVRALAVHGDDLYIGGHFTSSYPGGTKELEAIARFRNNKLDSLACGGLNSEVHSIAFHGDDMYIGGNFSNTAHSEIASCDIHMNRIARYDTLTDTWHPLARVGVDGYVNAIAFIGNIMYVGGEFSQTYGDQGVQVSMNSIGSYNISSGEWSPLARIGLSGGEMYTYIEALTVHNGVLYVGGSFSRTADASPVENLNNIATYNAGTWSPLPANGLNDVVRAIAFLGDDLYAGGFFTQTKTGSTPNLNRIARLHSGSWQSLANSGLVDEDGGGVVTSLAFAEDTMYVGGIFSESADGAVKNLNAIARYDLTADQWSALPNGGLNGYVADVEVGTSEIYAGGEFQQTADQAVGDLNRIARLITTNLPSYPVFLPLVIR